MSQRKFSDYLERAKATHGEKFSPPVSQYRFVRYYETGERIRVRDSNGNLATGTIGITGGWAPVFLLMRTSRSLGSSYVLGDEHTIVAVKRGDRYVPVGG